MAATVESRVDPGPLAGVRRASFGQCGMEFATTTMGTAAFRRLSNAADKAVEARNSLSAFELGAITALPVKRLSEELAAVLKKRDSWSASVSPLPLSLSQPDIVKADMGRSPCEAPSCSPNCKASVTNAPVKEPATLQAQYQPQHHQPWYSLLTCRLLSFIGGGGPPLAQGGEEYTTAVVSSHRLSFDHRLSHEYRASLERRVSESASLRSLSMDSGGSEFCFSRDSLSGRRLATGRRRAHEFAREDTYERDTSFYSEMACAPVTRLSGLSISSARVPSADLDNIEAEEEEMDKMVFRRRRDAYKEAWRRSASQDTTSLDGPAHASAAATCVLAGPGPPPLPMPPAAAGLRPTMPRIDSTDFANEELMRRNDIFCGRL